MTHTPGPWSAVSQFGRTTLHNDNDDIAYIQTTNLSEEEGNIKLMAAAPELLEALELCLEELDSCDHAFEGTHYCGRCDSAIDRNHEIREKAARAIAKAKGEST